MAPV
ncbi:hypothetical protein YPPY01_4281, partial [Yersinia pestis PY-01]|jgi:uncharacterized protein